MLRLFNTLGRAKQEFIPLRDDQVGFYTCGPTVYNYAHIGNFRAYLSADTLRRWLTYGHQHHVRWVLNITDVDDKTIRDSKARYPSLPPMQALNSFTREYEDAFFEDLKSLGIDRTSFFSNPRATEFIPHMQDLIREIAKKGFAKEIDGSVFFDVQKWAQADRYGKLLPLDLSQMKSGTRTLADETTKDDMADFALWKAQKEGEPFWDFDYFGTNLPGRPGWHLECSAMEKEIFGLPFDIHSGGVDLIFPHHEDEIAQSCCGYGCEPTRYWIHNEHLLVDGKKMSKSLGNFYILSDLTQKGHSPEAIRFFLVTNQYRTKLNLTEEGIVAAENSLRKLRNFLQESRRVEGVEGCLRNDVSSLLDKAKQDFASSMDDDLNTPLAISAVHVLVSQIQKFAPFSFQEQESILDFFLFVGNVLGVSLLPQEVIIPEEVRLLAEERYAARNNKDWAESDRLRDEICNRGYEVRDRSGGYDLLPL
jgi:cysteinyl-tRNA synthetase